MYFFDVENKQQLSEFMDWLESQHLYPIEFYLNGVVYTIKDENRRLFFCLGAETVYNILKELNEK